MENHYSCKTKYQGLLPHLRCTQCTGKKNLQLYLSRDCWDLEGGDLWESCQKLENLRLESENIAGADIEYDSDYSNFIPPRSRWRPPAENIDGPLLPEIALFDRNWSGMEAQNGGHRLILMKHMF